jgi:UDP-glucose 4-epimerase
MEVVIVRLNNLIASNGSAIPAFIHKILNNKPLTITDPEMTRFFMTTKRAVELIEEAFNYAGNGEILINYTFPCKLDDIVKAVLQLMNVADGYPREIIGPRPGEKKFEYLITQEEKPFIHNYTNTLIYNPDAPGCFNSAVCSHEMPLLTVKEIISMISEEEL